MPITAAQRRGMQQCTICRHERRVEIEQEFARGLSRKRVADQFGLSSEWPGFRHWRQHVSAEQKAALKAEYFRPGVRIEQVIEDTGVGLMSRLQSMRGKLSWLLDQAVDANDAKPAAAIAGQLLKLEELAARANGDLIKHQNRKTTVVVTASPEYQAMTAAILMALRPFPEAEANVLTVIREQDLAERAKLAPPLTPTIIEGEFTDATDATTPLAS
jgi:hypothetical protein